MESPGISPARGSAQSETICRLRKWLTLSSRDSGKELSFLHRASGKAADIQQRQFPACKLHRKGKSGVTGFTVKQKRCRKFRKKALAGYMSAPYRCFTFKLFREPEKHPKQGELKRTGISLRKRKLYYLCTFWEIMKFNIYPQATVPLPLVGKAACNQASAGKLVCK